MHPPLGQWKESEVEDIVSAFRETSERGRQVDTVIHSAQLSKVNRAGH